MPTLSKGLNLKAHFLVDSLCHSFFLFFFCYIWLPRLIEWMVRWALPWFNVLPAVWAVATSSHSLVQESMRTHSFPGGNDLITGSDVGGPEPKWPTACGTRAARSNSRGTVTNRSLHVQKFRNVCTCPLVDASFLTELHIFWARMYLGGGGGCTTSDITANFGSGSPRRPSSSCFLTDFPGLWYIIY